MSAPVRRSARGRATWSHQRVPGAASRVSVTPAGASASTVRVSPYTVERQPRAAAARSTSRT